MTILKKKSIIANRYIRNGTDYGFDPPEIKIIFDNKTYQFEINKISRSKAVDVYNFYDHLLKRKRFTIIYSPYKDFVENGITYKKKNKSNNIGGYTIKIIRKNNKDFIQKKIYFNKSRLVSKIKKKNDNKNIIFFKYHNKIYPFKLEMTKPYIARFSDATDKGNSYKFLFDILFSSPTDTKKFMFVKNNVPLSSKYPFSISLKELTLLGEVDIYLSDKLYSNDKSFLKNVPETGAINVDSNLLFFFRNQLQDPSYNVSKIYGFPQKSGFHSIDLKFDNFMTDFDFKIKMKKQSAANEIKTIFESNLYLLKENTEIEAPPTIKETIEGKMDKRNINILKKQIDLKALTHAFENFFLYDLENMINEIYVTQLNKYGLITFSGENKNNKKLDLVTPDNNIKFQLKRDVYENSIGFELAKVHEKNLIQ